jgi:hypothetical protein
VLVSIGCSVALERRASGFHLVHDIPQVAAAARQVVCGSHQRVAFAQEMEHRVQFFAAFRGSAAALLGPDQARRSGGSQGGLSNGKVLSIVLTSQNRSSLARG